MIRAMRVGIAHHLGWAVAVTADGDHAVVDRRRIELVGPGLPAAPVHHEGGPHAMHRTGDPLDDDALAALVAEVRASAEQAPRRSTSWPPRCRLRSGRCRCAPGTSCPPRSRSSGGRRTRAAPTR